MQRSYLLLALTWWVGAVAQAQPAVDPAPPPQAPAAAPAQAPADVPAGPASAATTAATAPPAAPGSTAAACILGAHDGFALGDARTTAALTCDALREAGANVSAQPIGDREATGHGSAYRVELRPLGSIVVLDVAFESPVGKRSSGRALRLNSVEEVPIAAPRIADSLVHGKPLDDTARVDTLVGQETRSYQKKYGETMFAVGVLGFTLPAETVAGYGAFARLYYEAAEYAVGADLRLGGSGSSDGDASLVGVSVGARYFFSAGDIAPFAGGGFGILWLGQDVLSPAMPQDPYGYIDYYELDGSGIAPFGEVGVEFLRLHDTRLDVAVRADAPLFQLEGGGRDRYTLPISLAASFSFD